jgi:HD-GYP domain-containing protein (c-di-GMP phosphodiesterase class II)
MTGLERRVQKLTSILEIAKGITSVRDLDRLLHLLVTETTRIAEAERSSLFIYDRERNELWSKVAEGTREIRFPASMGIAGAVVKTGQVSNIPDAYEDPRFNRSVDQQTGYRTRSILTVPMRDTAGEIVGALQTLNKRGPAGEPLAFDAQDEEFLLALAGVAASAVANAMLLDDIERLFEGFAKAAVVAIESRDPTTAGHSGRVAQVSVALAEAVDRTDNGRLKDFRFTKDQMKELRFAALLHDFGKVGVRQDVLVKAEKLYPSNLLEVEERFETIRRATQAASMRYKLDIAMEGGPDRDRLLIEEDARLALRLQEIDELLEFIHGANKPTILPEGTFERVAEIAAMKFEDSRGRIRSYLTDREAMFLAIRKGTLTTEERDEIENHVVHTYNFLSQIPWTRQLKNVPDIAFGHHEKLTGRGYPRGLRDREIPLQTRVITISDIYDALTAKDRPYKRAITHEAALDILNVEARDGNIDRDLLKIFIESEAQKRVRPL